MIRLLLGLMGGMGLQHVGYRPIMVRGLSHMNISTQEQSVKYLIGHTKHASMLLLLMLLAVAGCNPQAKIGSVAFDLFLATQQVNNVEIKFSTDRRITGDELKKLLASMNKTNRVAYHDSSKGSCIGYVLRSGTNELAWLWLDDNGTWSFRNYEFRLLT